MIYEGDNLAGQQGIVRVAHHSIRVTGGAALKVNLFSAHDFVRVTGLEFIDEGTPHPERHGSVWQEGLVESGRQRGRVPL